MDRIPVTRPSLPDLDEYIGEIKDLWDSHWITNMASKHELFRELLKEYLGVDNINLCCNGHLALENALDALNLPRGSEIITTPYTFASTVHAIVRRGYVPVLCDVRQDDLTIDPDKIEELISEKTSAILAVHVYGNVCDVDRINDIGERYSLKVIYDAAHAFGVKYKGRSVLTYGDTSIVSFHATKVFHTIEGGAVCYTDRSLTPILDDLKNFGIRDAENVLSVGGNAKMNEFCAAMGICNLRHIDDDIKKRRMLYERYVENLKGCSTIRLNKLREDVSYNYSYFPVFTGERDRIFLKLRDNGIDTRKYFYPIVSEYDCYRGSFDPSRTPVALEAGRKVISLPLYKDLETDDVDRICEVILDQR